MSEMVALWVTSLCMAVLAQDNPQVSKLYNKDGLPASPFRTND